MNFMDIVRKEKSKKAGVDSRVIPKVKPSVPSDSESLSVPVLIESEIPAGMPLTNRLDKMTREQAVWTIRNGDVWLAYLRVHGGEVYAGESASDIEVSPADQFKAICETLNRVWWALVGERDTLRSEQIPEWIDTLRWAVSAMPAGYERHREIIQSELERWQGSGSE